MKPRIKLDTATTPDGGEMVLYRHDRDYLIEVNGIELMHSRRHESELALARLGCGHLAWAAAPRILVGGLGMGYTLRQTLDLVGPGADVVVAELMDAVATWNRDYFDALNGAPLADARVHLETGDIADLLSRSENRFDAILLDVDNGPGEITDSGNRRLYGHRGVSACRRALRGRGCLALWSAMPSKRFEQTLLQCGFRVSRFRVPLHRGSKSKSCFVWVASEDGRKLPPGGGQPRAPAKTAPKKSPGRFRERR